MTMLHLLLLDQIRSGAGTEAKHSVRLGVQLSETHNNGLFRCQFVAYDGLRAASEGDTDNEPSVRCRRSRHGRVPAGWACCSEFAHRIAVLSALADGDYAGAYAASWRIGPPGEFPPTHTSPSTVSSIRRGHRARRTC